MAFIPDSDQNSFQPDRVDRSSIIADQERYTKEANRSLSRRFLSALPGATYDVVARNPMRFVASAATAPVDIGRQLRGGEPLDYNIPGVGRTFQSEAVSNQKEIVEGKKPLSSALFPFAEVPLAAAEAVGVGKTGPRFVRNIVNKSITGLEDRTARKAIETALEITKPKLKPKEQIKAFQRGRGVKEGFLKGKTDIISVDRDIDVAEASAPYVKKGDEFRNISNLRSAVDESGKKIREGLKQNNAIWNSNELKGWVDGVQKPITVKSDKSLNNQADNLKRAVIDLAGKQEKKTVGILDLRQDFDSLISKEYPNLYEKENTPIRMYIKDLRRTLNDFAEDKIPEGVLPNGVPFREELRKQHLLLEAIENISEKAPKVGSTRLSRFKKNHPGLTGAARNVGYAAAASTPIGLGIYGGLSSQK